jgi:hypothetical protein
MTEISDALKERMVSLVRGAVNAGRMTAERWAEANRIVAELPAPVDPDLLLAREVCVEDTERRFYSEDLRSGKWDGSTEVRTALAAIKRVRAEEGK